VLHESNTTARNRLEKHRAFDAKDLPDESGGIPQRNSANPLTITWLVTLRRTTILRQHPIGASRNL
jgi:hypothetical protein